MHIVLDLADRQMSVTAETRISALKHANALRVSVTGAKSVLRSG